MRYIKVALKSVLIFILLFNIITFSYAKNVESLQKTQFDMFDNRMYLGADASLLFLSNNWGQNASLLSSNAELGVEKLFFNSRVWFDFNLTNLISYHQLDNNIIQPTKNPLPFDPNLFTISLKVGRAFQVVHNHLQITPYGLFSKNSNMTPYSVLYTAQDQDGVKYINSGLNNFFWTAGFGGRLEYAVSNTFDFYLDEHLSYSYDNAVIQHPYVKQNNIALANLLGMKWQAWNKLQFAVEEFYNYQDYLITLPEQQYSQFRPKSILGTRFVVGLTF